MCIILGVRLNPFLHCLVSYRRHCQRSSLCCVAQSVARLTQVLEVPGSIPVRPHPFLLPLIYQRLVLACCAIRIFMGRRITVFPCLWISIIQFLNIHYLWTSNSYFDFVISTNRITGIQKIELWISINEFWIQQNHDEHIIFQISNMDIQKSG